MDSELQEVFNYAVGKGINLFDTADSYVKWLLVSVRRLLSRLFAATTRMHVVSLAQSGFCKYCAWRMTHRDTQRRYRPPEWTQ